jgi:DNA polymerase V
MFALVDANSFYCAVEQVFRPAWRGKPVVVLSNNDGCVVAANRQAKEVGIEKFRPYFEMRELCRTRGVIVCSSNYELYSDLSDKMMAVIGRFAPEQHIYSIDECFLSFERCGHAITDLTDYAARIRRTVWRECRLPVSIGIGTTATLAKVASHAAKKIRGYNGVCVIDHDRQRQAILADIQPGDIWGIGKRTAKKLKLMTVDSALDLARIRPDWAKKAFNINVEKTVRELNGEVCYHWQDVQDGAKQIFSTRSVGTRITDLTSLTQALCKHADIAATKLRRQGSLTGAMIVFAANSPHDVRPVGFKQVHRFVYPTDDTVAITKAVSALARGLFRPGVQYYKLGVGLVELSDATHVQRDLFDESSPDPVLMKTFDRINQTYGPQSIFMSAQGIDQKWAMRREMLSPQYTTRWRDIPGIECG